MNQQCSRRELLGMAAALAMGVSVMASKRAMAKEPPETPTGPFKLPELPYAHSSLAPYISAETLHYHHDKHHAAYVKKLNELVQGTKYAAMPLEEVIKTSGEGPLFNNAAQDWNHSFYWKCMSPNAGGEPTGRLADRLKKNFGDFATFKKQFAEAAMGQFGSGWAWLVKQPDGSLAVEKTSNADLPLVHGRHALLTCNVWEHAYYLDYQNERAKYVEGFWHVVNWNWVATNDA